MATGTQDIVVLSLNALDYQRIRTNSAIQNCLKQLKQSGIKTIVVSDNSDNSLSLVESNIVSLDGDRNEISLLFGEESQVITIDRAGFIRRIEPFASFEQSPDTSVEKIRSSLPRVEIDLPAPNFRVTDAKGRIVDLESLRGSKVLLTFFPQCFTSGCAEHLRSLQQEAAAFEAKGIKIIAVSVDPSDIQLAFAESMGLSFPLVPDVGRNICFLYGTVQSSNDLSSRRSFLIDESGVIRYVDRNVDVTNHGQFMLNIASALG